MYVLRRRAGAEPGGGDRLAALDVLIDRRVVLSLAREVRSVSREETAAALDDLRRAMGEAAFRARLARFGLAPKDLEPYLEDRILFGRSLDLRFSQSIPVSVTEIERHYRDIYVPEQARLGAAAQPLDRVAETIEARIRDERRAQQTAGPRATPRPAPNPGTRRQRPCRRDRREPDGRPYAQRIV